MPNWSQLKENSSWTKPTIFQEKLAHDHLRRKRQLRTITETIQTQKTTSWAQVPHLCSLKFFFWSNACNFMHLYAIFIFATKRHQVSKRAETAISWDKHPQTCGATCGLAVCKVCALAGVLDPQTPHFVYFVQWGGLFYMDGVLNTVVYTL